MSNIHRFLSRRGDRRQQKVNNSPVSQPQPPLWQTPVSSIVSSVSSFLSWRHRGSHSSSSASFQDDNGPVSRRRSSLSTVCALFEPPFSLDGAGSIRRPRKRSASAYHAPHIAIASTANCDIALTLQTAPDVAPDEGTFAGFFVPDEESKKKRFEKDEEKTV